MSSTILTTVDNGVLTVCFNRPEKKNALTLEMYGLVTDAIKRAEQDPAIRVIVFTGSGDTFTSGNDIGDFLSVPPDAVDSPVADFLLTLSATDIPILAAVNGRSVGVGTTMLMHFEKVYAVDTALFSTPFINLAVVPEAGSSMLMPKFLGYQQAARLLIFGETIDASLAKEWGLVSELRTAEDLMPAVLEDAQRIAKLPKKAMRNAKRMMRLADQPLNERIEYEFQEFGVALNSPEAKEAMHAFMEKRPADFSKLEA